MIHAENGSALTGADEIDSFILLCMQRSSQDFVQKDSGAGIPGKCIACIAPDNSANQKEGENHGMESTE